jgi:hypothetical protein
MRHLLTLHFASRKAQTSANEHRTPLKASHPAAILVKLSSDAVTSFFASNVRCKGERLI